MTLQVGHGHTWWNRWIQPNGSFPNNVHQQSGRDFTECFTEATANYGIPSRVRCDNGGTNKDVARPYPLQVFNAANF
ncbi:hypothetical protein DPMN_186048 [Dreissena polymorpha]|uniref:Integrase core domain-containing protein n=1 Tax=Dreissena polymorpha TaxID=45954 RepID=A0A9D4DM77_DREPO|nr:hypothetical protein DPMN_186048 [Dreissena polymorpha]